MSYTTFGYDGLSVTAGPDGQVSVSVRVTNTGSRRGTEVVQVYVAPPPGPAARPPRELRAFAKLDLQPGAAEVARFTLTRRDFAYWSVTGGGWAVPPGSYRIDVGSSSREIRASAAVDLAGPPPPGPPLDDMATLADWLADPRGREALLRAVGTGPDGRPNGIAGHPGRVKVMGSAPLRTLAAFPGTGLSHAIVDAVTAGLAAASDPSPKAASG